MRLPRAMKSPVRVMMVSTACAGLLGGEGHEVFAAAGGAEVVEAGAVDAFFFDEVEDLVEVLGGVAGEGEAEADFLAGLDAVAEALHGAFEGAFDAAEFVVNGGDGASRGRCRRRRSRVP